MKNVMCQSSYFEGENTHLSGKFLYISVKSQRYLHSHLFIHLTNIYWVPPLCIALYEALAICHSFFFHEHLVKLSLNWLIHAFIILGKMSLALDRKLEMTRVQTIASCKYRSFRPQTVTPSSWKSLSSFTLLLCCSYFFRLFHTLKFHKVLNI